MAALGCSSTASPSPSPSPTLAPTPSPTEIPTATARASVTPASTAGWIRHEVPERGFALLLPPSWETIDLTADDWRNIVDAAASAMPALSQILSSVGQLASSGGSLLAIDADASHASTGFFSNLNVIVSPANDVSLGLSMSATAAIIRQTLHPPGGVESSIVELPAGQAGRLTYVLTGFGAPIRTLQFYLIQGGQGYVVTLSRAESDPASDATFEAIARSFEFIPIVPAPS